MGFIDAVDELGRRVQRAWSLADMSEPAFAEIAQNALQNARLQESFNLHEVVQWIGQSSQLPRQHGVHNFGEPPLTLFVSSGFYIELYFWLQPRISIHDHGFSGSFTVLQGSSLQIKYRFDACKEYGNAQIGTLEASSVEPMEPGDVSLIPAGMELIHQVWHLDQPTISLIVRTESSSRVEQQRNYFSPGLAVANSRYRESANTRLEMLKYLIRSGEANNAYLLKPLFSRQDPTATFYSLLQLDRLAPHLSVTESIRDYVIETLGELGQRMTDVLEVDQLQRVINFSKLVDSDQRYMAALLLSTLTREQIIRGLSCRCGHTNIGHNVARWLTGIVESLGEDSIEFDFAIEIVALAAEGCTFAEIQSALMGKLQLDGSRQFEIYYSEVKNLAILSPLLPARTHHVTS